MRQKPQKHNKSGASRPRSYSAFSLGELYPRSPNG
jgi:hypothetical protein